MKLLILLFLFISAFTIRLYNINTPFLEFNATRQYRSAQIARYFYYDNNPSISKWRIAIAEKNKVELNILEPPINEWVSSKLYHFFDCECYWIPRLLSIIQWIIGSIFFWIILNKLFSLIPAFIALSYYLFSPFGLTISRSFLPENLMVMFMLASLMFMLRYFEKPGNTRLSIWVIVTSLAVIIKPMCIFVLTGIPFIIFLFRWRTENRMPWLHLIGLTTFAILPAAIFYAHIMPGYSKSSFLPELLFKPEYWLGWASQIVEVVGYLVLMFALISILISNNKLRDQFIIGGWLGYFAFCLTFNYHIHTHNYYHIQLIPIIAVTLGALFENSKAWRVKLAAKLKLWQKISLPAAALMLIILGFGYFIISSSDKNIQRSRIRTVGKIFGINPQIKQVLKLDDSLLDEITVAEEIGSMVEHSKNTIFMSFGYGKPLTYHGEFGGHFWPSTSDLEFYSMRHLPSMTAEERLDYMVNYYESDYFIVTNMYEFEIQQDLQKALEDKYSLVNTSNRFRIYDLIHQ